MARKTAPQIKVSAKHVDDRKETQDAWDETEKEFAHIWQQGNISGEMLKAKGMEIVKDADGKNVMHGADVLCRKSVEVFKAEQETAAQESRQLMAKIAGSESKVTKKRNPVVVEDKED